MTRKEFEHLRVEIQQHKFQSVTDVNPINYAIQRAAFKQDQLKALVSAGRKVKGSKTVAAKLVRWERQIEKLTTLPERFQVYQMIT
ncbi:MAG: hypothetical protein H0X66_03930 [Verrucomicrobia bacterium]|nr:hypothetical protein [Verrucomicrobiota bacterium]